MTGRLLLLPILLLTPPIAPSLPSHAPPDGRAVVRAMRERGAVHSYRTLTFVQTTTFPGGRTETWYESMQAPGLLRIDVAPVGSRTMLFRHDSIYVFRDGTVARKGSFVHPLLVLLTDVYNSPADETIARLSRLGFDLATSHDAEWQGRQVHVVGAAAGDSTSPQFWVDQKDLVLVRMIERQEGQGRTARLDSQILGHRWFGKALVETGMRFLQDGEEVQREDYNEVVVNPSFEAGIFDPARNVTPAWIAKSHPAPAGR
jgi:hypothetical protein